MAGVSDILSGGETSFAVPDCGCGISISIPCSSTRLSSNTRFRLLIGPHGTPAKLKRIIQSSRPSQ